MNSWEDLEIAGAINCIDLHPFSAPQRLALPDGSKTAALSVDFGGNAIRLLVKEGSAGELIAAGKWSGETPLGCSVPPGQ